MKTNSTGSSDSSYHAYLLKIWLEHERQVTGNDWRFSLENAHSGIRRGFTDLDSLLIYLQDLTGPQRDTAE